MHTPFLVALSGHGVTFDSVAWFRLQWRNDTSAGSLYTVGRDKTLIELSGWNRHPRANRSPGWRQLDNTADGMN